MQLSLLQAWRDGWAAACGLCATIHARVLIKRVSGRDYDPQKAPLPCTTRTILPGRQRRQLLSRLRRKVTEKIQNEMRKVRSVSVGNSVQVRDDGQVRGDEAIVSVESGNDGSILAVRP